jgi:hypothetical protein
MLPRMLLLAALVLPFGTAIAVTPDCAVCRDQLGKALEHCKTEPAGAAQEVCREAAVRDARACEKNQDTPCEFDLLLDPPQKPDTATPQRKG